VPNESSVPSAPGVGRNAFYFPAALGVIVLGTIFHLTYSTHLELVGDEAYYWLWSRHPAICYVDKGPMIAWLIAAGTALFGQTVFAVRFFGVLLASGTGLAMLLLARRLFSDRVAFWAIVVATIVPLFAVGSSLMTIDTIYVFFWSWAALTFWWAKDAVEPGPWVLTGILVGLGLLSKYTAALELVSFAAFCLWHRPSRTHLGRITFWSMLITALLFLTPALVWNLQHQWPTMSWLEERGGFDKAGGLTLRFVPAFLGEQAGVISPFLFLGLLFIFFRPSLWRSAQPATGYATLLFLPLFGLYLSLSLHYLGQPNWTAAAYVGGIILLAAKWSELTGFYPWTRWLAALGLIVATAETICLLDTRWLHLPPGRDPLDRARGSRNLAAIVAQEQNAAGAGFIIADGYMTASLLSFYLPGQPQTFVPTVAHPHNQLEFWPGFDQTHPHGTALIVDKRKRFPSSFIRSFARVTPLKTVQVFDGQRKIATYYLYLGLRR